MNLTVIWHFLFISSEFKWKNCKDCSGNRMRRRTNFVARATRRPGDQATRRQGDQATRRPRFLHLGIKQKTTIRRTIVHCRYHNINALRFTRIIFRLLYQLEYTEYTKKRTYMVYFHSHVDSYRSLKRALYFQ